MIPDLIKTIAWTSSPGRLDVRKVFQDGADVLTWFDLSTRVAETVPVANWMHIEDGKVTQIKVAFDARGIAGGSN